MSEESFFNIGIITLPYGIIIFLLGLLIMNNWIIISGITFIIFGYIGLKNSIDLNVNTFVAAIKLLFK